jgi:hypothetical protein
MRIITIFAFLIVLSLSLSGQSGLTGSCRNGGTYPACVGGEVVLTGTSYPAQVHVTVTNSSNTKIDDGDYTTTDGVLSFTENLSFADTYTISVNDHVVLTITTN